MRKIMTLVAGILLFVSASPAGALTWDGRCPHLDAMLVTQSPKQAYDALDKCRSELWKTKKIPVHQHAG